VYPKYYFALELMGVSHKRNSRNAGCGRQVTLNLHTSKVLPTNGQISNADLNRHGIIPDGRPAKVPQQPARSPAVSHPPRSVRRKLNLPWMTGQGRTCMTCRRSSHSRGECRQSTPGRASRCTEWGSQSNSAVTRLINACSKNSREITRTPGPSWITIRVE
jgi:hypothetical protein